MTEVPAMTRQVPLATPGEILLRDWLEPLGIFSHTDAQSWMNLQTLYDTETAREKIGASKLAEIQRHALAA